MAYLQPNFQKFHDKVRLSENNENARLREKRTIIVDALGEGLKKYADSNGTKLTFAHFNQGSYAMGIGIVPNDGDYDIDVGIIFDNKNNDFIDSVELKTIFRDAIDTHNRNVAIRRPCVTVTYMKDGVIDYHVDLAIYVKTDTDALELALGREHSESAQRRWEASDPKGLIEKIKNRFSGDDAAQFRRCIRYLKKWRDNKFAASGAPISIGLTCAAYDHFSPERIVGEYSDIRALSSMATSMLVSADVSGGRLVSNLPVQPWNDLFDEMTDSQMTTFVDRVKKLGSALDDAKAETSVRKACEILQKQFGEDFEVPDDDDGPSGSKGPTGAAKKSSVAPFVTPGTSA